MRYRTLYLTSLAFVAGTGCNNSLAPFQPEVANNPGTFQLQATGVKNVSNTFEYTWQNAKTTANVNQATVITFGTATLTILDAQATQVYSSNLSQNGTFTSSAGTAGAWKIRLALSAYSGTLNFRVQSP